MEETYREQMITYAERLGDKLGCSRLEATARALEWACNGISDWPAFMRPLISGTELADETYPEASTVLRVAWDLGDYGFTLDDLIEAVGPDMVVRPKAYKNQLSRLLRDNGFFRKQVRREGDRPLMWFHPQRSGVIE